jgi:hypothetical protein
VEKMKQEGNMLRAPRTLDSSLLFFFPFKVLEYYFGNLSSVVHILRDTSHQLNFEIVLHQG